MGKISTRTKAFVETSLRNLRQSIATMYDVIDQLDAEGSGQREGFGALADALDHLEKGENLISNRLKQFIKLNDSVRKNESLKLSRLMKEIFPDEKLDTALPNDYRKFVPEAVRDDDTRSFDDVVFAYLDKQKASGVTDGMTLAKSIRVKFGFQLKQAKLMVIDWSKRKSAIKEASANGKLSPELKEKFLNIASALSPENISWDGERPKSAIARERSRLNAEWKKLEAQVGRKVSEDEVWTENTIIKEEAIPSSETFKNATTAKAFIAKYAIRGCTGFYGVTDRQGYNARFFQFDPKKTDKNSAVRDVIKFVRVREGDEMLKYSSVEIVEKSPKRIVIKWILPDSSG